MVLVHAYVLKLDPSTYQNEKDCSMSSRHSMYRQDYSIPKKARNDIGLREFDAGECARGGDQTCEGGGDRAGGVL